MQTAAADYPRGIYGSGSLRGVNPLLQPKIKKQGCRPLFILLGFCITTVALRLKFAF